MWGPGGIAIKVLMIFLCSDFADLSVCGRLFSLSITGSEQRRRTQRSFQCLYLRLCKGQTLKQKHKQVYLLAKRAGSFARCRECRTTPVVRSRLLFSLEKCNLASDTEVFLINLLQASGEYAGKIEEPVVAKKLSEELPRAMSSSQVHLPSESPGVYIC